MHGPVTNIYAQNAPPRNEGGHELDSYRPPSGQLPLEKTAFRAGELEWKVTSCGHLLFKTKNVLCA